MNYTKVQVILLYILTNQSGNPGILPGFNYSSCNPGDSLQNFQVDVSANFFYLKSQHSIREQLVAILAQFQPSA